MKFAIVSGAALAFSLIAAPAHAALVLNNIAYNDVNAPTGPFVALPDNTLFSGGSFQNTTTSDHAAPAGTTPGGTYWSVGPSGNGTNPATLNTGGNGKVTFLWGSVDNYNSIDFLDAGGNTLASLAGILVGPPANGDQGSAATNRYVTLNLKGGSLDTLAKLRFNSSSNAFETTNFLFTAVPEASTWAMMILGIGFAGVAMRRRREMVSVKYA